MPELGSPADFSSALISLSRAPSKTAVPNQMPDGLRVVQVEKLGQCGGAGKARLEEFAHFTGRGHLRGFLGNLLAQFVRRPAQMRLQNLSDVHT